MNELPASDAVRDMVLFVGVARALSFTRASKALGVPVATLSRRIAALERRLGVELLRRSTRRIVLTEPAQRYLAQCERVVEEARAAEEALVAEVRRPAGHLRVAMPVEFGLRWLAPIFDEFLRAYPEITLDLDLSQRPSDVLDERIDVSIRLGEVRDPGLVVRRLGSIERRLYAAPAYLARRGAPGEPSELAGHAVVVQSYMRAPSRWRLVHGDRSVEVDVRGPVATNNVSMTLFLCERGHGIGAVPEPLARDALREGRIERVLEGWALPLMPVNALTTSRLVPASTRALLDLLAARLEV